MTQSDNKLTNASILRSAGNIVRTLRTKKDWSQEHLAEMADVHDRTIGKIERGELNFSITILLKLCKALECKASDIIH